MTTIISRSLNKTNIIFRFQLPKATTRGARTEKINTKILLLY